MTVPHAVRNRNSEPREAPELVPLAVYTSGEAAAILRVSVRKLRQLTAAGDLRTLPYATGKALFSGQELARYIGAAS